MTMLDSPSAFTHQNDVTSNSSPIYWYEGCCPRSGELLRLPRTQLVEAIAQGLMQQFAADVTYSHEGKMYGVLLVETPTGKQQVLKAFSGLLNGNSSVEGWVPSIPGRDQVALQEACTLASLETMKQELIALQHIPERHQYETVSQEFKTRLQELALRHHQRKQERQQQRQVLLGTLTGEALEDALEQLDEQSRQDGIERRYLKRQRDAVLQPLKCAIEQFDTRMCELKHQRKALSRQLQAQMHAAYWLTNFTGEALPLQDLMPEGMMPTGTGDCCAPKLLHHAATHHLKPLAMAEFWWGPPSISGNKIQGEFYAACAERCQPLLGFLLSGLTRKISPSPPMQRMTAFPSAELGSNPAPPPEEFNAELHQILMSEIGKLYPRLYPSQLTPFGGSGGVRTPEGGGSGGSPPAGFPNAAKMSMHSDFTGIERSNLTLPIVYEDEWLIAVDKPAGLLSVPGRYRDRQDSVLSRLRHLLLDGTTLAAVHRLDQETSGILLMARNQHAHCQLSQQFQQRHVDKIYEAVLSGLGTPETGVIELPLWGDPCDRPYQKVDWQRGKPSVTRFQVMAREGHFTRVEFIPVTGRTHQLRVHAADLHGIGLPILGDRLYGCQATTRRLHLHAREIRFVHPHSGQTLHLRTETPF